MERGFTIGSVLAMITLGAACADSPYQPKLKDCTPGWSVQGRDVFTFEVTALAWADGVLYTASDMGILAAPVGDGSESWLVRETWPASAIPATDLWIEGDNLLYAVEDRLMRVPRTGGTTTTLVAGGHGQTEGAKEFFAPGHLYDGTYFTWASSKDYLRTTIWRIPVSGGAAQEYPSLPTTSIGLVLVPVADGILGGRYGLGGGAMVAPWGQETWRALKEDPAMDTLLTMDNSGTLWTSYNQTVVGLAPADGSPWRVLSTKLPPARWGTPDGKGGYFIACVEKFDDDREHDSMWYLAPDGKADRIACNPDGSFTYDKAALAPDALYISAKMPATFSIARISRPVP